MFFFEDGKGNIFLFAAKVPTLAPKTEERTASVVATVSKVG